MKLHAVVWIDTDGDFHILSFSNEDDRDELCEYLSSTGLPAMPLDRMDLINKAGVSAPPL